MGGREDEKYQISVCERHSLILVGRSQGTVYKGDPTFFMGAQGVDLLKNLNMEKACSRLRDTLDVHGLPPGLML